MGWGNPNSSLLLWYITNTIASCTHSTLGGPGDVTEVKQTYHLSGQGGVNSNQEQPRLLPLWAVSVN